MKHARAVLLMCLFLTLTASVRVVGADEERTFCIVLLSHTRGDQRPLLDKLKAVRAQLKITKSELPMGEFGWDIPLHRKAIEEALGLKEHHLPLVSTGEMSPSGMPTSANRNRPSLKLPDEVIAYYLINEWARRAKRPMYPFPYAKTAPKLVLGHSITTGKDGSELVLIPAGAFWRGSTEGEIDELPPSQIPLPAYRISKTEVTVSQFARFVQETSYLTVAEEQGFGYVWKDEWESVEGAYWRDPNGDGTPPGAGHPVRQLALRDCQAYCSWAGLRLPTEDEWEKAARGTGGRQYPWGDRWEVKKAVYGGDGPEPVGSISAGASPYGLMDMAGNVREWTDTVYGPYFDNGEPPSARTRNSVRGGSWGESQPAYLRAAYRFNSLTDVPNDRTGFRVAGDADSSLGLSGFRASPIRLSNGHSRLSRAGFPLSVSPVR